MGIVKTLFWRGNRLPDGKYEEIQIYWDFCLQFYANILIDKDGFNIQLFNLLELSIRHTKECDHAGIYSSINLLGLSCEYSHYDTRHWDHKNNRWDD